MKNAWSFGVKGFPAPFDFPFGGDCSSAFFASAFGEAGVPTAAATADGVAGAAFAGTKGVPAFEETDFFRPFQRKFDGSGIYIFTFFNQKTLANAPKGSQSLSC